MDNDVEYLVLRSCYCLSLFPEQGQVFSALILFVIANVSFEFGTVFCNAYLH